MFDPTEAMSAIHQQLDRHLKDLAQCKNLDERVKLSEIVKNLADSSGVFLSFAADMAESFGDADWGDEELDD